MCAPLNQNEVEAVQSAIALGSQGNDGGRSSV